MDIGAALRNSKLYAAAVQSRTYLRHSLTYRVLQDERYLGALLLGFVSLSVLRILASNTAETVKFLSFAVLFLIAAWLVATFADFSES